MNLRDTLLLSLAVVFLIIGIHQTMVLGFDQAYWALMLAMILFFVYTLKKRNRVTNPQDEETPPSPKTHKKAASASRKSKRS